jgi:hypothetical protein
MSVSRINSNSKLVKATCATVAQVNLASDPNAPPGSLASLPQQELENRARKSVEIVTRHVVQAKEEVTNMLVPVLMELENRYEKQIGSRTDLHGAIKPGWHAYLRSLAINPGTYRMWKSRAHLSQLKSLILPPPTEKPDPPDPPEHKIENGAQIMAEAGMQLASTLLDPTLPEPKLIKKAKSMPKEMQESAAELDINIVSRPKPQWVPSDEEIEALTWIIQLLGALIGDKSTKAGAEEARKYARIVLGILQKIIPEKEGV